jgi:hypothetical protein
MPPFLSKSFVSPSKSNNVKTKIRKNINVIVVLYGRIT